jgi:hypothetical protein
MFGYAIGLMSYDPCPHLRANCRVGEASAWMTCLDIGCQVLDTIAGH